MSSDPDREKYPWLSVYAFAGNGPIANIDADGRGPFPSISAVKALAAGARIMQSTLSVSTSASVAFGTLASATSGIAVDKKGNVLIFNSLGGIAAGRFGITTNASATVSVGGAVLPWAENVSDLLGDGLSVGGSGGWKEAAELSVGGNAEFLGNGDFAGVSVNAAFGYSVSPIPTASGSVVMTKTTGIMMSVGELEQISTEIDNAETEFTQLYYDMNAAENKRTGGNWMVSGVWQGGNLTTSMWNAGKDANGNQLYEPVVTGTYFFVLNSQGSKEGINPNLTAGYTHHTGVYYTKDDEGNYVSAGYEK